MSAQDHDATLRRVIAGALRWYDYRLHRFPASERDAAHPGLVTEMAILVRSLLPGVGDGATELISLLISELWRARNGEERDFDE